MKSSIKKKKIPTLDELLASVGSSRKDLYELKYSKSLRDARANKREQETVEKLKIRTGYYSLRYRIQKNPWVNNRPASKAASWLFKTVFKDPAKFRYRHKLLYAGGLFMFEYFNPKYKGTSVLPWFDKYPLVLSLGPKVTNEGPRNIGFNLHLLPPRIRIIVLCAIFEIHKQAFRYQVFMKTDKPVEINYGKVVDKLKRLGVKFAIRMYIPNRQKQIVCFPIKEWHRAIFIPSKGYDSIRSRQLIKEWRTYNQANGYSISPQIDWRANI